MTFSPARSTLTRLEAVISSKRHPIGIKQEVMLAARDSGRQMGENEIISTEMRDQSIDGRQRYALPHSSGATWSRTLVDDFCFVIVSIFVAPMFLNDRN
jgi:hypothetical protein